MIKKRSVLTWSGFVWLWAWEQARTSGVAKLLTGCPTHRDQVTTSVLGYRSLAKVYFCVVSLVVIPLDGVGGMPVPSFDHNGVLPPHLGDPTNLELLSPYPASSLELCEKLGTTPERRRILYGLLALRESLRLLAFTDCFQWIDGSFMEDCESRRGRAPGDIDVVTFARYPDTLADPELASVVADHRQSKDRYHVDHFIVGLNWDASAIVENSRYWALLFSHSRHDRVWKGMVRLELEPSSDDVAARELLTARDLASPPESTTPSPES